MATTKTKHVALVGEDLFGETVNRDVLMRERFMEPPFSVLDTKGGAWQARKKKWKALGLESHLGREGVKVINDSFSGGAYGRESMPEVSIFDPALCELMYNWFCPAGGTILDPFAGGSVRGIVAGYLGFRYTGIDIRAGQVDANVAQALKIIPEDCTTPPEWVAADSNEFLAVMPTAQTPLFDMVFTCPPYADLEVYSDLEGDISNKPYKDFIRIYTEIIQKACRWLKPGGFAVFVVGDVRDKSKDGFYLGFPDDTKTAFRQAGLGLYNDAVLLQPLGTAMLRAPKIFEAGKKLTKVHENVLMFKKPV